MSHLNCSEHHELDMTIAVGELYQVEHFVTFYIRLLMSRTMVHVEVM